ncbi:MAG TPA: RNA methyltransferase [Chlamydiales bacterium]|nr:RNA methyltransferase [Chlamydiales bacterium]
MLAKKISSLQHPAVLHWSRLVQTKAYREEHKSLIITGEKLVKECAKRKILKSFITTFENHFLPAEETYLVTPEILKKITALPSPDGYAAEVFLPPPQDLSNTKYLLILDQIFDPGNLGTLLRTAFALGWEGVALTPGTVDLFNDKALRAAKGATFLLPYTQATTEEIASWPHQLIVADMDGKGLTKSDYSPPLALILSHESKGAALWPKSLKVAIPMRKEAESLNVAAAGAIFLYEMRPQ